MISARMRSLGVVIVLCLSHPVHGLSATPEPKPERLPITVRIDFGPADKPGREERLLVDKGSTPKDALSMVVPIQSGEVCCNTREVAAIDGIRPDPTKNRWWNCRLNDTTNFSPFLKELQAGDKVEWIYSEQLQ